MTEAEMDDLYEIYVLGALEPELAADVEQYLRAHPVETGRRLAEAASLAASMAGIAEEAKPSAELRQRVLAAVTTVAPRRPSRKWSFAFAALAAACLALAVLSVGTWSELQNLRTQVNSVSSVSSARQAEVVTLTNERDRLRAALAAANSAQQAEIAAISSERDRLRTSLATANRTQSAVVAERNQLRSSLDAANSTNQAQVAALTGERDQLRSSLENANSRSQAQIASLTSEIAQLRTALAAANNSVQTQMASLRGEVDQLQSAFNIIRRPDTRSIKFGSPQAPNGWVFANRAGGLVLVASRLPAVASDRTLELWLVPNTGAPQPAGLFRPSDASGNGIQTSSLAVNPSQIKAIAVSDEPRAGSTAPTTTPFLIVPLG